VQVLSFLLIISTIVSCTYHFQGKKVSKEDYKYCSKINEGLPEFVNDSSNKYGFMIRVPWVDCANVVENEYGNIEYIYGMDYCSCKEYVLKLNASKNDSLLYNTNLNNELR
jgi:hypothetical protein